jgi:gluconolactonase
MQTSRGIRCTFGLIAGLLAAGAWAADDDGLPPAYSVSPQLVLMTNHYTEGAVFDAQGNFYFSETHEGLVTQISPVGIVKVWATVPGANGHRVLRDGTHVLAARRSVALLNPQGEVIRTFDHFEGTKFIYPNDMATDSSGGWYLTDSGTGDNRSTDGALYYVTAQGEVSQPDKGMAFPNGIAMSPDGAHLYVDEGNLDRNHVLVYDVAGPGALRNKRELAVLPHKTDVDYGAGQIENKPDGMCIDTRGRLYVSHWGMGRIEVLSPGGELLRSYSTGHVAQSNCAFGGPHHDQLMLTGAPILESGPGSVTRLDLGVQGVDLLGGQ